MAQAGAHAIAQCVALVAVRAEVRVVVAGRCLAQFVTAPSE